MPIAAEEMPVPVTRESNDWKRVWEALDVALKSTPLPADDGGTVSCDIDDFMLVGVDANGSARFKNTMTRNYLLIEPNGALVIPKGGFFHRGVFAHLSAEETSMENADKPQRDNG